MFFSKHHEIVDPASRLSSAHASRHPREALSLAEAARDPGLRPRTETIRGTRPASPRAIEDASLIPAPCCAGIGARADVALLEMPAP